MIPAGLFFLALLVSLFVQTMTSPLAGAWLVFFLFSCAWVYKPPKHKDVLWLACTAWLIMLFASTFLLRPIGNGAAFMWVLVAMPMLAISVNEKIIAKCIKAAFVILLAFATGLILQLYFHVHYTNFEYVIHSREHTNSILPAYAYAWPLVDPNNAACVVNCGLLPAFYLALRKRLWWIPVGIFAFALFVTASKAGGIAAAAGIVVLLLDRFCKYVSVSEFAFVLVAIGFCSIPFWSDDFFKPIFSAALDRLPIWKAAAPLAFKNPITGLGLGSFGYYYSQVRTEHGTSGMFAHNDVLQFAIEMGIPAACVFILLVAVVAVTTSQKNIAAAAVMLAVLLQGMVEFQFYVPPISILMGLALAYHRLNRSEPLLQSSFQSSPPTFSQTVHQ